MMKAMDDKPSPSTQPMPMSVAMLNGACSSPNHSMSNLLMMPMRGWSRNTQPIDVKKVGSGNRNEKPTPFQDELRLECWSIGVLECWVLKASLHYSTTPALQFFSSPPRSFETSAGCDSALPRSLTPPLQNRKEI